MQKVSLCPPPADGSGTVVCELAHNPAVCDLATGSVSGHNSPADVRDVLWRGEACSYPHCIERAPRAPCVDGYVLIIPCAGLIGDRRGQGVGDHERAVVVIGSDPIDDSDNTVAALKSVCGLQMARGIWL